jgi:hypothetical protein
MASNSARSVTLIVLLAHMPDQAALNPTEKDAIAELKEMLDEIANVKIKHKRHALRPKCVRSPNRIHTYYEGGNRWGNQTLGRDIHEPGALRG